MVNIHFPLLHVRRFSTLDLNGQQLGIIRMALRYNGSSYRLKASAFSPE